MKVDIYVKKSQKTYETKFGIPFECVELVRRFLTLVYNVSFPSVVDAIDFYYRITSLSSEQNVVHLNTFTYPYARNQSYYLRPGTMLFWKRKMPYFPHGHVAIIIESNENETTVIQQNLNPPVKIYNTKELFTKMNRVNSKFLGVKTIPKRIPRIEYNVVRI
jgi:hypothetical protein